MPISDLRATSRRILRKLLGRSRRVALAAALVPLGSVGMSALAAPSVPLPPEFPGTPFSIRVTDMERIPGDAEGDAFRVELQVLNWARTAHMFTMAANNGSTAVDGTAPLIAGASVDADGRGGPPGGSDIGTGIYDPVAIHSGYGRGDAGAIRLNNWLVDDVSPSFASWGAYDTSAVGEFPFAQSLPGRDLLGFGAHPNMLNGFGTDALGDTAIDGGPRPYTPEPSFGGYPVNDVDGVVLDIDDWDVGEVFSLNWFLAAIYYHSAGYDPETNPILPVGTADEGSPFGFGVLNLVRIEPTIGASAGELPGAVFADNTGFDQSGFSFYDTVYEIPNPAEFAAEVGVGITAPFLNPGDNIYDAPINTRLVPESSTVVIVGCGILTCIGFGRRRRQPKA